MTQPLNDFRLINHRVETFPQGANVVTTVTDLTAGLQPLDAYLWRITRNEHGVVTLTNDVRRRDPHVIADFVVPPNDEPT